MRDEDGYIWAILTNSLSRDAGKLGVDFDVDMEQALDTGLEGSPTDLYLDYPSPDLPARHQ
jgi:hypothetical protein